MVDKFYKDINHGSHHKDDDSSNGPNKSNTGSKDQSKGFYGQEIKKPGFPRYPVFMKHRIGEVPWNIHLLL